MTLPLDLRHLLPLRVADQGVDEHPLERDLADEVQAHHHHPGDPEEDDVEAGDQGVGRIEPRQVVGLLRPAQGRERPQRRRRTRCRARPRPGAAARRGRSARGPGGRGLGLGLGDEDRAVRAVPGRDAVAPPELARDAPGLDVAHPLEVGLLPVLRARRRCRPSSTASIAGWARVLASTYHWSVR